MGSFLEQRLVIESTHGTDDDNDDDYDDDDSDDNELVIVLAQFVNVRSSCERTRVRFSGVTSNP